MNTKLSFSLALIVILGIFTAPSIAQNGDTAPTSISSPATAAKLLVLPPNVTAFGKKDKFYGRNEDLVRALQQFFTFTNTVMTTKEVIRVNFDDISKTFPSSKICTNQSASNLRDKVDKSQLDAAAKAYGAQYVLFMENSKDTVQPSNKNWTMNVEVKFVIYNAATGEVSDEKTYLQEEDYAFDSENDMKRSRGGFLMTFSGNLITMNDIASDPMKFGGTIGGFPFVTIAKRIAADISAY